MLFTGAFSQRCPSAAGGLKIAIMFQLELEHHNLKYSVD